MTDDRPPLPTPASVTVTKDRQVSDHDHYGGECHDTIAQLRAALATANASIDTWMAENADLKRRLGNLAASHDFPRVQDVARIYELEQSLATVKADRDGWMRACKLAENERNKIRAMVMGAEPSLPANE